MTANKIPFEQAERWVTIPRIRLAELEYLERKNTQLSEALMRAEEDAALWEERARHLGWRDGQDT